MKLIPAVKALILDGDNALILRKLSSRLDLPGGKLKQDECDIVKELMREVQEETNIDIDIVKRIIDMITIAVTDEGEIVASVYLCKYKGGEIKLSREHTDFMWTPISEINNDYPRWIQEAVAKVS